VTLPGLGPRGEGWVVLQLALLGLAGLAVLLDHRWGGWAWVAGGVVGAGGLVLLALSARDLGRALTPFPLPNRAGLAEHGVYGRVRHPMYGGVLLLAAGWSVALAPLGLVPTVLLVAVFDLKARREEAWLETVYPGYGDYRARVRRRLLPGLY
jgi:protein-S-isoprenylcysteine O-methyltransferase Ste14